MKSSCLILILAYIVNAQNSLDELISNPASGTNSQQSGIFVQGSDGYGSGDCLCVPYYDCDARTGNIIENGQNNGFGVIDIRFGENKKCQHYLEKCCNATRPSSVRPPITPTDQPINPPVTPVNPPVTPVNPPINPDSQDAQCGIRIANGLGFKITGNSHNEAEFAEFPWMMAILKKNYNPSMDKVLSLCGGSLIHPQVVLTGAHCVETFQPNQLKVRGGEWDTQTTNEQFPYQERDIQDIIIHETFSKTTLFNDVALLVLTSAFDFAPNIGTVCLPPPEQIFDHANCFASGWGKDVFGKKGAYQVILKKVELPVVPRDRCTSALQTTRLGKFFKLHNSFICAGGEAGRDTCTGDGGSPLVCADSRNPKKYMQAGIVAWGIGCGENNIPGVYANVALFRDWIDSQMSQLNFGTETYTQ